LIKVNSIRQNIQVKYYK